MTKDQLEAIDLISEFSFSDLIDNYQFSLITKEPSSILESIIMGYAFYLDVLAISKTLPEAKRLYKEKMEDKLREYLNTSVTEPNPSSIDFDSLLQNRLGIYKTIFRNFSKNQTKEGLIAIWEMFFSYPLQVPVPKGIYHESGLHLELSVMYYLQILKIHASLFEKLPQE
jgi:hypothetical protein